MCAAILHVQVRVRVRMQTQAQAQTQTQMQLRLGVCNVTTDIVGGQYPSRLPIH